MCRQDPRLAARKVLGKISIGLCLVQVCDDRPGRGGAELSQLLHLIPPDKLMIETDGPYLVPRTIKPAKTRPRRCHFYALHSPSSCIHAGQLLVQM